MDSKEIIRSITTGVSALAMVAGGYMFYLGIRTEVEEKGIIGSGQSSQSEIIGNVHSESAADILTGGLLEFGGALGCVAASTVLEKPKS